MGKAKKPSEQSDQPADEKKPKKIAVTHHSDDLDEQPKTAPVVEEPETVEEEVEKTELVNDAEADTPLQADEVVDEDLKPPADELDASEVAGDNPETPSEEAVDQAAIAEEVAEEFADPDPEADEQEDETKKQVGPAGPYQPDLSMTIEEAEAEAEVQEELAQADEADAEIDAAVDDIIKTESDEALETADEKLAAAAVVTEEQAKKGKLRRLVKAWWRSKRARWVTLGLLLLLITLGVLVPSTRYGALNAVGVRVSTSMRVIDSQTRLPLKNIEVSLQDKTATTDETGMVAFDSVKLGSSELAITKRGYAQNIRTIVLGWGSNPIGDQELVATGEQFTFTLTDWQTGAPVKNAEATTGESSAVSDDKGVIVLTVAEESVGDIVVTVTADGYRSETVEFTSADTNATALQMVPDKRHAFVSNRDGQYDLYAVDVDGQNESIVLAASGKEREVPFVLHKPQDNVVAYVSSRDGEVNSDGFVLEGLFIVNVSTGSSEKVTRSEQLRVIGWSGDRLVYWQIVEGTSAGNPQRSKLIAYNYKTGERTELAAANYFNSVLLVDETLYYAVSSFAVPQSQAKLFSIKVDGADQQTVVDSQVWNIYRTSYNTLLFSAVGQKWYEKVGDGGVEELGPQSITSTRQFVDSPLADKSAWVEIRDGKGVLLVVDTKTGEETTVLTLPGLSNVEYWIGDDNLVFKVITNSETADYFINLDKGEAIKIRDVTATRNTYF